LAGLNKYVKENYDSQGHFARRAGYTRGYINSILRGKRPADSSRLIIVLLSWGLGDSDIFLPIEDNK
jgi:transcriptional regulator with XRE-family HTH domain